MYYEIKLTINYFIKIPPPPPKYNSEYVPAASTQQTKNTRVHERWFDCSYRGFKYSNMVYHNKMLSALNRDDLIDAFAGEENLERIILYFLISLKITKKDTKYNLIFIDNEYFFTEDNAQTGSIFNRSRFFYTPVYFIDDFNADGVEKAANRKSAYRRRRPKYATCDCT